MAHFLDIIIPVYNTKESDIKNLLNSINYQKNVNFEEIGIIIVDDHSNEKIRKSIFRNYPKLDIAYYEMEKNGGPGIARQYGTDRSEAKYITYVDSDDELYQNDSLAKAIEILKKSNLSVVITTYIEEYKDIYGQIKTIEHKNDAGESLHGLFIERNFLINSGLRFIDGLRCHEDAYFRRCLISISMPYFEDIITYIWKVNSESIVRHKRKHPYLVDTYDQLFYAVTSAQKFLDSRHIGNNRYTVTSLMVQFIILESNNFDAPDLQEKRKQYEKELFTAISENNLKFNRAFDYIDYSYEVEYGIYKAFFEELEVKETFYDFIDRMSREYPDIKVKLEKAPPFLDIIIPYYDISDDYIRRLIKSIYNQKKIDFTDLNVTIVSDASPTDVSASILNDEFKHIKINYIKKDKNEGQGLARQYGFDNTNGKYVTYVDQDDLLFGPDALYNVMMNLSINDCDLLFTDYFKWDSRDNKKELWNYKILNCLHGAFYKREALIKNQIRFNDKIRMYEDNYFCTITYYTLEAKYLAYPTYIWAYNSNSQTVKAEINGKRIIDYFDDFITANMDIINYLNDKHIRNDELFVGLILDSYIILKSANINNSKFEKIIFDLYKENQMSFENVDVLKLQEKLCNNDRIKYGLNTNIELFSDYIKKWSD